MSVIRMKKVFVVLPSMWLLWLVAGMAVVEAKDYGVFVDGGYGRKQTKLNDMVTDRVDRAKAAFDRRSEAQSSKASSKEALCAALEQIRCGPGDTLTVFMMGHGNRDNFVFSKARGSKKKISAIELKAKISAAITDCTCKVRVVIFSCHSGSFLDDLFKDIHVKAVYTSCAAGQKSYSDAFFGTGGFEDRGDWADEFVKKLEELDPEKDLKETLDEANRCANEKSPSEFSKWQRPTGWRRGTFRVKAHVESKFMDVKSRKVKVTFYDPAHLRGKVQDVIIDEANGQPTKKFSRCTWVEFDAEFGGPKGDKACPKQPPLMVSPPIETSAPEVKFLGHVEENPNTKKGLVSVKLLEPWWLVCKKRYVKMKPNGKVGPDVKLCGYIKGTGTLVDPGKKIEVGGTLNRFNHCPEVVGRVKNVLKKKGQVCIWILRPLTLKHLTAVKPICIVLPSGERGLLKRGGANFFL